MQGVSLINHPNGQPAVLTIYLDSLPADISPLVAGLLTRVQQEAEEEERRDFMKLSASGLERAYGDDEPDYSDANLIWKNQITSQYE